VKTLDELESLFAGARSREYLGEPVTLADHMLQAAALAEADGASDTLVAAALLHDIGHILAYEQVPHELAATLWLTGRFPRAVSEAVRMHVDAKRYLCAVDSAYYDRLSDASRRSLVVQGGPMTPSEVAEFEQQPYATAAISVRRWDEAAKDPSAVAPPFEHFRALLQRLIENGT
jgi:gamma-butyrobetaine dioxygenase